MITSTGHFRPLKPAGALGLPRGHALLRDGTVVADFLMLKVSIPILVLCGFVQLLIGANPKVVITMCSAAVFGVVASALAGGMRTIIGAVSFIHVLKVVLFAIILKTAMGESLDSNLKAPEDTGKMLLLGYIAMLAAVVVAKALLPGARSRLANGIFSQILPSEPRFYLALGWSFLCVGTLFWIAGGIIGRSEGGGGGILKLLGAYKSFSVACFVFYLHAIGSRRVVFHPLVIGPWAGLTLLGVIGATKQGMLEPSLFVGLAHFCTRGFDWKRYALAGVVGFCFAQFVVYPFSQNAKMGLVTQKERASTTEIVTFFIKSVSDPSVRSSNRQKIAEIQEFEQKSYFGKDVGILGRIALVYEQSWLVEASIPSQRTGWYTIGWAIDMLFPRFIKPSKPLVSAAPWLGSFSGVTGTYDENTSISFGYMANFYHAYGLKGVLVGGFITPLLFFIVISLAFGFNSRMGLLWAFAVAFTHHTFVEAVLSSMSPLIFLPGFFLIFASGAMVISRMLPQHHVAGR